MPSEEVLLCLLLLSKGLWLSAGNDGAAALYQSFQDPRQDLLQALALERLVMVRLRPSLGIQQREFLGQDEQQRPVVLALFLGQLDLEDLAHERRALLHAQFFFLNHEHDVIHDLTIHLLEPRRRDTRQQTVKILHFIFKFLIKMNSFVLRPGQNPFAKKKPVRPVVRPIPPAVPPPSKTVGAAPLPPPSSKTVGAAPLPLPSKTVGAVPLPPLPSKTVGATPTDVAPPSYRMEKKTEGGRIRSSLVLEDNNKPRDGKRFRLCRLENGKYALREVGEEMPAAADESHYSPLKKDDVSESVPIPVLVKKQKQELEPREINTRVVIPLGKTGATDFVTGGGLYHPLKDTTFTKAVEIAPFLPSAAVVERVVLTVIAPDLDVSADVEFTLAYLEANQPGLRKILSVPLGAFTAQTAKIFSKNPEKEDSTPKTGSFLVGIVSVRPTTVIRRGSLILDYTVTLQQKKYRREQVIEIRNTQEKLSF